MTQHSLTISGRTFTVSPKFEAGHVLTANEAATLNQTWYENLRNNFAGKAKEGGSQEDFDAYASKYEFGVRTGGGGSRDPVEVEAMNLARDAVRKGIQNSGKKVSDYTAKAISEAAAKLLERNPVYREKARERVAQMQEVAGESIDPSILDALAEGAESGGEGGAPNEGTDQPSTEPSEEAPARGRGRRQVAAE